MILLFLSAIMGIFSFQFFSLNFSIQGLNRAVISTPIELMYKVIVSYGDEPSFNKKEFEKIVNDYYDHILPRYTKKYDVSFYYYNLSDESMCLTSTCNGVEITVSSVINLTYHYSRTMHYELSESHNG